MRAIRAMKHPGALCERLRDFIPAVLMTLAILTNPVATCAQNDRGCAWPLEMSPEGVANFQFPDNSARYWIMPFETQYDTMTMTCVR